MVLKFMPYAQANVSTTFDGAIILRSYSTKVACITVDGWLYCFGLYSMTTRRHISAFMREYGNGNDYYVAKRCYEDKIAYNIYTGEIISLKS